MGRYQQEEGRAPARWSELGRATGRYQGSREDCAISTSRVADYLGQVHHATIEARKDCRSKLRRCSSHSIAHDTSRGARSPVVSKEAGPNKSSRFRSATAPAARRDDEEYREYFEEEQRSRRRRPARKMEDLFGPAS
jgi:hypothetical protein